MGSFICQLCELCMFTISEIFLKNMSFGHCFITFIFQAKWIEFPFPKHLFPQGFFAGDWLNLLGLG